MEAQKFIVVCRFDLESLLLASREDTPEIMLNYLIAREHVRVYGMSIMPFMRMRFATLTNAYFIC